MRIRGLVSLVALAAGCSSEADPTECGPGTIEEDGRCMVDGDGTGTVCGDGTHEQDGECVPDDTGPTGWYELSTQVVEIGADGISRVPILAIGEEDDGAPAAGDIQLSINRADGGEILSPVATLGELGAVVYFRPCNAMIDPGCTGPVEISMALAAYPEIPVATLELELVEPIGVYTAEPCLRGDRALFLEGDGFIFSGIFEVTGGEFTFRDATDELLDFSLQPAEPPDSLSWNFSFSAETLGLPLVPGVYETAERWPFQTDYRPGLDVGGQGRGCNTLNGRFQVHEYERDGTSPAGVTITFEQYCEPYEPIPQGVLFGCVHFQP